MHVFSPDGSRLSFTYNDHVMHEHCPERDQRNIGVALPMGAVRVKKQHPREYDGSHFCVLVSATTPTPRPGSDDITRAYEEGWIGKQGYLKRMVSTNVGRWHLSAILWIWTVAALRSCLSSIYRRRWRPIDAQGINHCRGPSRRFLRHRPASASGV